MLPIAGNTFILSFNKTHSPNKASITFLGKDFMNKEKPQFLLLRLSLFIPIEVQF